MIPLTLVLFSCGAQKWENTTTLALQQDSCPTDGTCTTELLKNKTLVVKRDDIGQTYYQLLDNEGSDVIRYQYTRTTDAELADAGYREELVFEIDRNSPELKLEGSGLQKTKMLFGRFCFCRDQTGYYPVNNGSLAVKPTGNNYTLKVGFTVPELPQIVNKIEMTTK